MKKGILTLVAAAVLPLAAQDSGPHFEVASIKLTSPNSLPGASGFLPGGRFVARRITVERLLEMAFRDDFSSTGPRPEQIVGAPSWFRSTTYEIEARTGGPTSVAPIVDPQAGALVRSLLVDRFKLRFHLDKRELPFYALLLAKGDGSLGPDLKPSKLDCDAIVGELDAARRENRPANVPASVGGRPVCRMAVVNGAVIGGGVTAAMIADTLTAAAGNTTVLDRTGLSGRYDVDLRFSTDRLGTDANAARDPDAPSLFTAVREQLGLTLEMRREPRPVLVVDQLEPPTPD